MDRELFGESDDDVSGAAALGHALAVGGAGSGGNGPPPQSQGIMHLSDDKANLFLNCRNISVINFVAREGSQPQIITGDEVRHERVFNFV